jgi:RNA recognition motif-containing protein
VRIYAGNFDYSVNDAQVLELFTKFGKVDDMELVRDPITEQSCGFAFIEMPNDAEASRAIKELDKSRHCGRILHVNEKPLYRDSTSAKRDRKASMQSSASACWPRRPHRRQVSG